MVALQSISYFIFLFDRWRRWPAATGHFLCRLRYRSCTLVLFLALYLFFFCSTGCCGCFFSYLLITLNFTRVVFFLLKVFYITVVLASITPWSLSFYPKFTTTKTIRCVVCSYRYIRYLVKKSNIQNSIDFGSMQLASRQ